MARRGLILVLFGAAAIALATARAAQTGTPASSNRPGVPARHVGNWICQTSMPGYNILPPHADPSQPLTNTITTPSTVAILKFSLNADGTYETATAKGHYTFKAGAPGHLRQ